MGREIGRIYAVNADEVSFEIGFIVRLVSAWGARESKISPKISKQALLKVARLLEPILGEISSLIEVLKFFPYKKKI